MSLSAYSSIVQRIVGYPIHWSVQGQVGWCSEKPALVGGVPAQSREVRTRWSSPVMVLWSYGIYNSQGIYRWKYTGIHRSRHSCLWHLHLCELQIQLPATYLVKHFSFDVKSKVVTVQLSFHIKNIMHLKEKQNMHFLNLTFFLDSCLFILTT